jgi:hypothetical protein
MALLSARAGASAQQRCSDVLARSQASLRPAACAALRAPRSRVAPRAAAPRSGHRGDSVRVFALDAAQPFDYEAMARRRVDAERAAADKLLIGACARAEACASRGCTRGSGTAGRALRSGRRGGGAGRAAVVC